MKPGLIWGALACFLFAAVVPLGAEPPAAQAAAPAGSGVYELQINGEIEPILAEYIVSGIAKANASQAKLILITEDTPGGLDSSMRDIIGAILHSHVPVAVYVTPSGTRAASAGFFILESADIAAMSPGTDAGAASPLLEFFGSPVKIDDTLERKIMNEATAYMRSYVARRGRNVTLAVTAVTDARAFSEKEALDGKLIDLVAPNAEALLAELDGRAITRLDGSAETLHLPRPIVEIHSMSSREQFLGFIVQPDAFFILLLVAVLGLYAEFTHPGMFAPGVIGGIALILALFAGHLLPINLAGLVLIILALAFFVMEAKFPSHGILGVGGAICMLLGAVLLIHSPITGGGVHLSLALAVTIPVAIIVIFLMRLVLRSFKWRQSTGAEQLVGATGEVIEAVKSAGADGMVRIHGELWRAAAGAPIAKGAQVRVSKVEGLTLLVEPVQGRGAAH